MAVGCSAPSNEETHNSANIAAPSTLDNPQKAPYVNIPRPFNSPRLMPRKRQLEPDLDGVDSLSMIPCQQKMPSCSELQPPAKQQKLELQRNMLILDEVAPTTPETKAAEAAEVTPERPSKFPSLRGPKPNRALAAAVQVAMDLFKEGLTVYALEKDLRGEDKADVLAEEWAREHYEEMKNAIVGLLPWAGEIKAAANDKYDVISFQGVKTTRHDVNKRQLEHFRAAGEQARCWEALSAMFAAISSRKEKIWLEYHDVEDEIKSVLKNKPLCKSKRSARRQEEIRKIIPDLVAEGAGAFSGYLLDPRAVHDLTFARGPESLIPATSMITRRMPLWDALKTMDDDGPLRAAAFEKEWCFAKGTQFALQDLEYGREDIKGTRSGYMERTYAKKLKPDKQLRQLLRSKAPVVLLDTLAALGPRDMCKNQGVSQIVTAELQMLFRQAKERGEAVIFSLGSDCPHKLAQKVYLRPPLADYGMRCGALRWRESAKVPWAREFKWDDRITLCLQLP